MMRQKRQSDGIGELRCFWDPSEVCARVILLLAAGLRQGLVRKIGLRRRPGSWQIDGQKPSAYPVGRGRIDGLGPDQADDVVERCAVGRVRGHQYVALRVAKRS